MGKMGREMDRVPEKMGTPDQLCQHQPKNLPGNNQFSQIWKLINIRHKKSAIRGLFFLE